VPPLQVAPHEIVAHRIEALDKRSHSNGSSHHSAYLHKVPTSDLSGRKVIGMFSVLGSRPSDSHDDDDDGFAFTQIPDTQTDSRHSNLTHRQPSTPIAIFVFAFNKASINNLPLVLFAASDFLRCDGCARCD
jgi:hypothetical protein